MCSTQTLVYEMYPSLKIVGRLPVYIYWYLDIAFFVLNIFVMVSFKKTIFGRLVKI